MQRFLIARVARAVFVLWGVSTIVFIILHLTGDPVALMLSPDTPPAAVAQLRQEMGLDQPLVAQYFTFLGNLGHGQFGESLRFGEPALGLVLQSIPATVELAVASIALAILIGIPIGTLTALRPKTLYATFGQGFTAIGQSMPTFFLGIVLILILSVQFRLLPTGGQGTLAQLLMPCITLGAWNMASIARITRSSVLDVIGRDFVRTARAKGLSQTVVLVRHVARNAAIPVLTVIGLEFGSLLGGAVVVETVFAWPGVGRLAIQSITNRDYPVVQACIFLLASGFVVINTLLDLAYGLLDPRIRHV